MSGQSTQNPLCRTGYRESRKRSPDMKRRYLGLTSQRGLDSIHRHPCFWREPAVSCGSRGGWSGLTCPTLSWGPRSPDPPCLARAEKALTSLALCSRPRSGKGRRKGKRKKQRGRKFSELNLPRTSYAQGKRHRKKTPGEGK